MLKKAELPIYFKCILCATINIKTHEICWCWGSITDLFETTKLGQVHVL